MKINRLPPDKHKFLQRLLNLANKPDLLHTCGALPPERGITVAIVGTRRPTVYGTQVACDFAEGLARKGIVIISGLAYGIDSSAHRAALEAQGTTVAVLAHGLDTFYPRQHQGLAKEIIEKGGALITEYPEGTDVMKHRFLERNRLVSGLADAIIVIEAGERSGTLSTVSHALAQGKEVFAVPGPITSELSIGPNRLIQQGAHPALSVDSILEVIAPQLVGASDALPVGNSPEESTLITLLSQGVRDGDTLQQQSGLDASEYFQAMTMLEINGAIRSLGSNQWSLR